MTEQDLIASPDLPELTSCTLPAGGEGDALELSGVRVEHTDGPVTASTVSIEESELLGVRLEAGRAPGLVLSDVILRDCDLSNVEARQGWLRRTEIHRSRLVGFALDEGRLQDLRVIDSSLSLASFAHSSLQRIVFERVDFREASFIGATLKQVVFADCDLASVDFRDCKVSDCAIRGSSLNEVLGIEYLRGCRMPWADVMASAGGFAQALGIQVEES